MPRGRPVNLDKRISDLVGQLKAALVARARQRIEVQVDSQVAGLVGGLQRAVEGHAVPAAVEVAAPAQAALATGKGNRKVRSAASRAAQAAKMKAYWAARRAGKGPSAKAKGATSRPAAKGSAKVKSAWANYTPAQRAARIAAMRAGHAKRRRAGLKRA